MQRGHEPNERTGMPQGEVPSKRSRLGDESARSSSPIELNPRSTTRAQPKPEPNGGSASRVGGVGGPQKQASRARTGGAGGDRAEAGNDGAATRRVARRIAESDDDESDRVAAASCKGIGTSERALNTNPVATAKPRGSRSPTAASETQERQQQAVQSDDDGAQDSERVSSGSSAKVASVGSAATGPSSSFLSEGNPAPSKLTVPVDLEVTNDEECEHGDHPSPCQPTARRRLSVAVAERTG